VFRLDKGGDGTMVRYAPYFIVLTLIASGCSKGQRQDAPNSTSFGDRAIAQRSNTSPVQEHDLGVIFAEGQGLRHDFAIKNPTDRVIRLISGKASTPCCSSIGPLPDSIPPQGEARIPVVFKAGNESGLKRLKFSVVTDDPQRQDYVFMLRGWLISAWEIERLEGSTTILHPGRSGKQILQLIARQKGGKGRNLPQFITVTSALRADYDGEPSTKKASVV
jgi:hypothetical protein